MVTVRLSRNESESNEWYDVTGDGGEQNGDSGEQNGDSCEQNGDSATTGDGGVRGNDGNVASSNQNVAARRYDNVAIGNFIVDVSDPRHAEYCEQKNGDSGTTEDGGVRGNDGNVASSNQNVAARRDENVAIGNFIVNVSDPRYAEYQQACLRTREQCVNDRWMHLYDSENFYRLQNAIINELKKINWNFD
jgi:hypothetical protein